MLDTCAAVPTATLHDALTASSPPAETARVRRPAAMLETGTNSVGGGALGGKLPHSHSTPAGVDGTPAGARTPPTTPKRAGKMLAIRVHMLDDSVTMFQIQAKALGRVLFDQVCKQLHLLEADYFGLEYQELSGTRYWLDLEKPLSRQLGLSLVDTLLRFCVKFYTPDPAQLEEEFTRYLFSLQVKRDLAHGRTQCNDNTAALMASYIVQAECGDYVAEDYPDPTSYLSCYKFVPHQDCELERRIMENHKKHTGQSPAEADLNLLETARRCELYGIKMHPAKDHEGVPLNLSVAHMGIVVFQNYTKINTFSWAKIRKISFKRKRFLIKLHPEGYGYYKDTVEFFFEGRNECKNFWKKCVENHGFFRCSAVKRTPRQRARVLSRGSSFRYSGKTQKQIVEFVRENYVKRTTFQRSYMKKWSQSFRHSGSVHSSQATNVGGSISAHPLIPLGENSIVSESCGSMRVTATLPESPRPGASPTTRRRATPMTAMAGVVVEGDGTITPTSTLSPAESLRSQGGTRNLQATQRSRSSQTDIVDFDDDELDHYEVYNDVVDRYTWQRSASCKELHSSRGREHVVDLLPPKLEAPVTRYDRGSCYSSKTPSLERRESEVVETKVYSSSYPGTTSLLSMESGGADESCLEVGGSILIIDPGSSREEVILSHDDLSHDSYELLDRERFGESRSCSLDSTGETLPEDEMFAMDEFNNDSEVEKRLGYVEPRYGGIGFNEFNEKCKQGFAKGISGVEFVEFDAKCRPGRVIGFDDESSRGVDEHSMVERTKSDPYMSDFWRVAKQHRNRLAHQKSIDLTPVEGGMNGSSEESRLVVPGGVSKSAVDIPYTLHKRHHMNGTKPDLDTDRLLPLLGPKSPVKSLDLIKIRANQKSTGAQLSSTKLNTDLNSQDSGLSLSAGTGESGDDLQDMVARSLSNRFGLARECWTIGNGFNNESVNVEIRKSSEHIEIFSDASRKQSTKMKNKVGEKKDLLKAKSEEKGKKGSLAKSRQALSAEMGLRSEQSFEKSGVTVIKIQSEGSDGVCSCDKEGSRGKEKGGSVDSSDPDVIIVEYRGKKRKAFQKRGSSGSKGSTDEDKEMKKGNLDASKEQVVRKKESKAEREAKRHEREIKALKEFKTSFEGRTVKGIKSKKVGESGSEWSTTAGMKPKNEKEHIVKIDRNVVDSMEIKSEPLKKEADVVTTASQDNAFGEGAGNEIVQVIETTISSGITPKEEGGEVKKAAVTSPETVWRKFGDLASSSRLAHKRDRSPVLFARLGLSESSAYDSSRQAQSPTSSRRAKSLDAPVVSLHHLPPVTSFSSKDDTLDNEECTDSDEKGLKQSKAFDVSQIVAAPLPIEERRCEFMISLLAKADVSDIAGKEELLEEVEEESESDSRQPDDCGREVELEVSQRDEVELLDSNALYEHQSPFSVDDKTTDKAFDKEEQIVPESKVATDDISEDNSPVPERRPSTRQERLDSFKNTKSYSVEIWTSEETELPLIPTLDIDDLDFTSKDFDDETFIIETMETLKERISISEAAGVHAEKHEDDYRCPDSDNDVFERVEVETIPTEMVSTEDECWVSVEDIREIADDFKRKCIENEREALKAQEVQTQTQEVQIQAQINLDFKGLDLEMIKPEASASGTAFIPEKRSFDDEPSSSSSIKPELSSTWKPFPLESSGSSSLEEGIFPPDDTAHFADEEEGSSHSNNSRDSFPPMGFSYPAATSAEMMLGGYSGSVFGLSRTLSRISERSTTSEQERSDFEDDISTKPSSRSLSVDDESILSSDRQPSLSSDPPSIPEVPIEDHDLPELPQSPPEPPFNVPPPLYPVSSEEWPSPPNSGSPGFDTPVVSHVETFFMEIRPEEATKVQLSERPDDDYSSTDENKTLQEEEQGTGFGDEGGSSKEGTIRHIAKKGNSASEDTSIAVSDWSSSTTATTVKHCHYYSCVAKSDDGSLAGDFGLSLSSEMLPLSRKSSDETDRRTLYNRTAQRSFDDYDSPYSESDEGQKPPPLMKRVYPIVSPTGSLPMSVRKNLKQRRGEKCYTKTAPSGAHDTSVEDRERKAKSIARAKCYSYYSLARSPPSDGSSSSVELADPSPLPLAAANTIPRVSKRRRHAPPTRRRHRISVDMEVTGDGHIVCVSSPSVVASSAARAADKQAARAQSKQSSV